MDMSTPIDPTVAALPLTDPACIKAMDSCLAFAAAGNASQTVTPFNGQFAYGRWTTYYWVILLGFATAFHIFCTLRDRRAAPVPASTPRPSVLRKAQAAGRWAFYRRPAGRLSWFSLPSVGTLVFILVTTVFLLGLTFAERPYYRPHFGYGSPPIAIRSGLMAFACIPILVALSGKANIITLLTGVSHERLNVLHRWVAWMSFGLSLVHTIPFFYASIYDEGDGGDQRVKSEFYTNKMRGANEYSGVPPLAMLFGLCILSLPPLRNKFYESFYAVHILLAITYLGLLFWHAANVNDSWAYLWATLAVWLASWAARTFYYTRPLNIHSAWFVPSQATLVPLPGAVTRIEVWPPEDFAHSPAQHVFLRFTALAPLDNHPFTIVSAPMDSGSQPSPLVFLARTHAGFTARLARYALANVNGKDEAASTPVWIDGPYGGVSRSFETRYDTLVLLAGGTGISACLPWMLSAREGRLKRVVLVWAVRRAEALAWVTGELEAVGKGEVEVVVQMHITGEVEEGKDGKEVGEGLGKEARVEVAGSEGKSGFAERLAALGPSLEGRPVMSEVLSKHVRAGERTMVFACGPEGFRVDVANAVAGAQRRVLSGECVEIGMHIETFGW